MRKLPYREGTWFAVPLTGAGFGVGVVARTGAKGKTILGYFFGPRRASVPTLANVKDLKPINAVLRIRVGDLGLIRGEWPIIGQSEPWQRSEWPMPDFIRREPPGCGRAWRVYYSETNLNEVVAEEPVSPQTPGQRDSLFGSGAAEVMLKKVLSESRGDSS